MQIIFEGNGVIQNQKTNVRKTKEKGTNEKNKKRAFEDNSSGKKSHREIQRLRQRGGSEIAEIRAGMGTHSKIATEAQKLACVM